MATQAAAATNEREGPMTEQPPERSVRLCLLINYLWEGGERGEGGGMGGMFMLTSWREGEIDNWANLENNNKWNRQVQLYQNNLIVISK